MAKKAHEALAAEASSEQETLINRIHRYDRREFELVVDKSSSDFVRFAAHEDDGEPFSEGRVKLFVTYELKRNSEES